MRTPRAYLAAFGTSGSLLVVAALAFIFASAFVSFRGFPRVASAGAPASVTVTPPPRAAVSKTARRLSVVLRPPAPAVPRAAKPPAARPSPPVAARPAGVASAPHAPTGAHAAPRPSPRAAASAGAPPAPAPAPAAGSGRPPANPVGQVVQHASGPANQVVSSAGSAVKQAAGKVPPANPGGVIP
jgi:DNA polymerase-3 subunit gamma/tau